MALGRTVGLRDGATGKDMDVTGSRACRSVRLAVAAAVTICIGGCAGGGSTSDQGEVAGFWAALRPQAQEANPATSLDDLTERSPLVVLAVVTGLTMGPGVAEGLPEEVATLHVRVQQVLDGAVDGHDLKIIMPLVADIADGQIDVLVGALPVEPALFFLEPSIAGYYATTAIGGIIADLPGEGPQAVLDTAHSKEIVADAGESIEDVVESVEEILEVDGS